MTIWLNHYPPGVPASLSYPRATLYDVLRETARRYPNHTATIFMDGRLTYRQLLERVDKMAAALQKQLGVNKGDRVALMLPNIPQMVIGYYAVLAAGAVCVGVNPMYTERELSHQIKDAGAKVIFLLDLLYPKVEAVREKSGLEKLVVTSIKDYLPFPKNLLYPLKARREGQVVHIPSRPDIYWFSQLINQSDGVFQRPEIDPEKDLAVLQYTGGTTGLSKGAMLTHRNIYANALQLCVWDTDKKPGQEVALCVLPFFHSYGMTVCMNISVFNGFTMVLIPRFDVKALLESIQRYRANIFPGTPTIYVALINHPDTPKYDLSSIRGCLSGAAPLPLEVKQKFEAITGGCLVEGYGLSETSPVALSNILSRQHDPGTVGAIGLPLPDTLVKIADLETGQRELPPGQVGEICVEGPQVMVGYWNRPEETAAALRDGWLYTGDIGYMDERGYTFIVDRKKDLIIAGGYNIYPREVEEVLYEHPKVREAAVIGVADPYRGETVKAFVVLKEGEQASEQEIMDYCRQKLAAYKIPRIVEFRPELPKTNVGKILRRVLAEEERSKSAAQAAAAEEK
ncbi:long-chain-fatty-acid--CoA ligase [Desulfurispora thermophila]|uniref:long-chain-fatty-acid--CoA ligase n=1 Tax=Desulfurispora thermophila TaxID=265470 RepID=UPI00037354F3|nr:long-chain fatty acid--CoA ligase [Desulfurispora thermophila]